MENIFLGNAVQIALHCIYRANSSLQFTTVSKFKYFFLFTFFNKKINSFITQIQMENTSFRYPFKLKQHKMLRKIGFYNILLFARQIRVGCFD